MTGVYQNTTVSYKKLNKPKRSCWSSCKIACLCISLILLIAIGGFFVTSSVTFPLHASCAVEWTFKTECTSVNTALVNQINLWKGDDNCKAGGQKCLYELKSHTDAEIKATHETPVKHYVDDLTFAFSQEDSICHVKGYSRSETWYALLDMGTNYCNLHNLITGSGLDTSEGYSESTSNSKCTQYSSADCDVYWDGTGWYQATSRTVASGTLCFIVTIPQFIIWNVNNIASIKRCPKWRRRYSWVNSEGLRISGVTRLMTSAIGSLLDYNCEVPQLLHAACDKVLRPVTSSVKETLHNNIYIK